VSLRSPVPRQDGALQEGATPFAGGAGSERRLLERPWEGPLK